MKTYPARLVAVVIAILTSQLFSVGAQADPGRLPPPERVSEHVYAWIGPHGGPSPENRGFRMNLAFVVGNSSVAVLEAGYHEPMAREMLEHIARITPVPVKYLINSNSQPDRFLGSESFRRRGATVIASAAEAMRMERMGGIFAQVTEQALGVKTGSLVVPKAPDRLLEAATELDLGGVRLRLIPFAAAHTPGPLVAHIPQDRVVYAGDILYRGRLPAVIEGGSVKTWLEGFERLREFGDVTYVPGHGKPGKLSDFEFPTRDYLRMLRAHMTRAVEQGRDMQDAMKSLDQSRFAKLANFGDLAGRNASIAYIEAEAEAFR